MNGNQIPIVGQVFHALMPTYARGSALLDITVFKVISIKAVNTHGVQQIIKLWFKVLV